MVGKFKLTLNYDGLDEPLEKNITVEEPTLTPEEKAKLKKQKEAEEAAKKLEAEKHAKDVDDYIDMLKTEILPTRAKELNALNGAPVFSIDKDGNVVSAIKDIIPKGLNLTKDDIQKINDALPTKIDRYKAMADKYISQIKPELENLILSGEVDPSAIDWKDDTIFYDDGDVMIDQWGFNLNKKLLSFGNEPDIYPARLMAQINKQKNELQKHVDEVTKKLTKHILDETVDQVAYEIGQSKSVIEYQDIDFQKNHDIKQIILNMQMADRMDKYPRYLANELFKAIDTQEFRNRIYNKFNN